MHHPYTNTPLQSMAGSGGHGPTGPGNTGYGEVSVTSNVSNICDYWILTRAHWHLDLYLDSYHLIHITREEVLEISTDAPSAGDPTDRIRLCPLTLFVWLNFYRWIHHCFPCILSHLHPICITPLYNFYSLIYNFPYYSPMRDWCWAFNLTLIS